MTPEVAWATAVKVGAGTHDAASPDWMAIVAASSIERPSSRSVATGELQMLETMAGLHAVGLQNCPAVHAVPHRPQWRKSRFASAQWFPQQSKPIGQSGFIMQVARH